MVVHRTGVSVLATGLVASDASKNSPNANIVFVHGLRGHPQTIWESSNSDESTVSKEKKKTRLRSLFSSTPRRSHQLENDSGSEYVEEQATKVFWPADLLPGALPEARILTYGYNADVISGLFSANNKNSILQHGDDLSLKLARALEDDGTPLIFVAHSLGGLVVKRAVYAWKTSVHHQHHLMFERVHGVVFCGTPHRGSNAADWGLLMSKIVAASLQDANTRILDDLRVDSQILDYIHRDFLKALHDKRMHIHSFTEARPLTGIKQFEGKVVSDFSSRLDHVYENVESIDANHMDMVRADGPRSPVFREIRDVLITFVMDRSNEPCSPQPAENRPYRYLKYFDLIDYQTLLFKVSQRHGNTCLWFLDTEEYLKWSSASHSSVLWLHGNPGLGKSVIAKFLLQSSQETEEASDVTNSLLTQNKKSELPPFVAYFFCSNDDEKTKSPRILLCSLIHQLLLEHPDLAVAIGNKYGHIEPTFCDSIWKLWSSLALIVDRIVDRSLIIIIDALDELEKASWMSFLENLRKIFCWNLQRECK